MDSKRYVVCCQEHGWIATVYGSADLAQERATVHRIDIHPAVDDREWDGEILVCAETAVG